MRKIESPSRRPFPRVLGQSESPLAAHLDFQELPSIPD